MDYARDVQPLLAAKCFACHGALKQQAALRLDASQLIRSGGDSGAAVVPGDPAASPLWNRISDSSADGASRMPPAGEGEAFSPSQLELIRRWIEQGAAMPPEERVPSDPRTYWSYQPPVRSSLPPIQHSEWGRTPIDAWIAYALEQRGLAPRVAAPREVWLRRVSLDLIGLPPTREELQAFLADARPDAEERVVDGLLERPEYGERWGRHWMDVWRYSDWYGSRGGNEIRYSQRPIWRWRDWIVESLNADRPYDRMLVEMLAGDELAPLDPSVHRATGFLGRNWYKFDRNVWMFDTVEQTGQAFLGLTFKCARCHDHKFDPITQEEYYRFRAFFEPHDVRTDPLRAGTPTEKDATLGPVLTEGVARVFDKTLDVPTYLFQRGDSRSPDEGRPLTPDVPAALGGGGFPIAAVPLPPAAFYPQLRPEIAEGLIAAADEKVRQAHLAVDAAQRDADRAGAALAAWTPEDAPRRVGPFLSDGFAGPRPEVWKVVSGDWRWMDGRLTEKSFGNFATLVAAGQHPRDFRARVRYRTLPGGQYRSVGFSFDRAGAGDSQDVYTSANDQASTVQAFHRVGGKQDYPAAGIVRTPIAVGDEVVVEVMARGQSLSIRVNGEAKLEYVMPVPRRDGQFALWVHSGAAEFLDVELSALAPTREDLLRAAESAKAERELALQRESIARADASSLQARLNAERAKYEGAPAETCHSLAAAAARAEKRGAVEKAVEAERQASMALALLQSSPSAAASAVDDARKKVAQAEETLRMARAAFDAPGETYSPLGDIYPVTSTGRRLALARWITRRDNPRTARVAVNHIWLRHFGQALVPSVANFGLNGDRPTHPELLDWLATELVEQGWSMKPLHRMIVLSAAYRQSSSTVAATAWSAEGDPNGADPSNRLLWRMNSRRMEAEVVRDSVLSSAGLLLPTRGGPEIPESEGETTFRRSLYFRLTPNEKMALLETFDVADPNACYRRQESVVPHQALAMMNSPLALEAARVLAERLSAPPGSADDEPARRTFIAAAFEQILSRPPDEREVRACLVFLEKNQVLLTQEGEPRFPAAAAGRRPPAAAPGQRARENLVHVLFNHNDFVTVR
ncbi:DUF1553 domain-containing protein [Planctomyces sp. SH-PL14]|uniref:DUF1553 domain-containing protein n=1 Tax=Planctomyces sp. SH-PL14 TaxID=1632864 RepID=UPI0018D38253|nr:DUF1553 domain-containing protein [Planctomyces sp. SH-PL14]